MSDEIGFKTQFAAVGVTLTRDAGGKLVPSYDTPEVKITSTNAVISFRLLDMPAGVQFWGLNIAPRTGDFGPPSIIAGGRLMTIEDTDRDKQTTTYNATLLVFDPRSDTVVPIDPQIINRRL